MFKLTFFTIILIGSGFAEISQEQFRSEALENIKNYMNLSVDPCDNFFHYACGNWKNYNKLSEDTPVINGHLKLRKQIVGEIKGILEQDTPIFNAEVELKVKEFYKSCLNTDLIMKKGYEPLKNFIKSIGGMPVLDKEWNESQFDFIKIEKLLQSYGFDGLFHINMFRAVAKENNFFFGEMNLPLSKENHQIKSHVDEYTQEIVKTFVENFGVGVVEAEKFAAEIVEFEMKISKGVADADLRQNFEKYLMQTKIEELQKKYPTVEWAKFFTEIFGFPIESSRIITEIGHEYIGNVLNVVKDAPKSVVANFMMWNAMRQFLNVTIEKPHTYERVTYCVDKTKQYFPKEIGVMYSYKFYDNEVKEDIESIAELIKKEFHLGFEKYDWIDDETKKLAYQRLDGFKVKIVGYPKDAKIDIDVDFNKIVIDSEEYFTNILNLLQYNYKIYARKIFTKTKTDAIDEDATGIQTFYSIFENTLKISLAFLKPPFYTKSLPKNMKFAQIGAILMHEFSHGFDTIGQDIDLNGNFNPWWSLKAQANFANKMECFTKQYKPYLSGAPIADSIADNGGIKYAFLTYVKWANEIKDSQKNVYDMETFTGLDFTNTQLFFITHAQTWCHVAKKEGTDEFIYPFEHRINIPMRNFDKFSNEFKCPEGTLMNPKDKCLLW